MRDRTLSPQPFRLYNQGVLRVCGLVLALAAPILYPQDQGPTAKPFTVNAHRYAFVPARIEVNQDDLVKIELVKG